MTFKALFRQAWFKDKLRYFAACILGQYNTAMFKFIPKDMLTDIKRAAGQKAFDKYKDTWDIISAYNYRQKLYRKMCKKCMKNIGISVSKAVRMMADNLNHYSKNSLGYILLEDDNRVKFNQKLCGQDRSGCTRILLAETSDEINEFTEAVQKYDRVNTVLIFYVTVLGHNPKGFLHFAPENSASLADAVNATTGTGILNEYVRLEVCTQYEIHRVAREYAKMGVDVYTDPGPYNVHKVIRECLPDGLNSDNYWKKVKV